MVFMKGLSSNQALDVARKQMEAEMAEKTISEYVSKQNNMNNYQNELFNVNAVMQGDEILFDVEMVAKCLGIVDDSKTSATTGAKIIKVRWSRVNKYLSSNGLPEVAKGDLIPEPAVYMLAFKASNETAVKFQMWLATEVLPQIRKTGSYAPQVNKEDQLLLNILHANDKVERALMVKEYTDYKVELETAPLKETIEKQAPKVEYHDTVLQPKQYGKLLTSTMIGADLGMSAQRLHMELRRRGILTNYGGTWRPKAKYKWLITDGYADYEVAKYKDKDKEGTKQILKWTEKGRKFIIDELNKEVEEKFVETDNPFAFPNPFGSSSLTENPFGPIFGSK